MEDNAPQSTPPHLSEQLDELVEEHSYKNVLLALIEIINRKLQQDCPAGWEDLAKHLPTGTKG